MQVNRFDGLAMSNSKQFVNQDNCLKTKVPSPHE